MFKVTLTRDNDAPIVQMKPWVDAVAPVLMYETTNGFTPGSTRPVIEKRAMYWLSEDRSEGYFPAGMSKRVVALLKRMGYEITGVDTRDRSRYFPEPDWSCVDESSLRPGQLEVLQAVVKADGGMIVCPTGFGKSHIIVLLTRMYRTLRFLIVAPGISETENLYARLAKTTDDIAMLGGSSNDDPDRRIVVSTSKSFLKADLRRVDMFIFDEAHACGNNKITQDILDNVRGSRMFGFTATNGGRSDKADILMEALYGPPLVKYGYDDAVKAGNVTPIEVQAWSVPGSVKSSASPYGNALTQNNRRFYWNNTARNLLIKAIAESVPENEQLLIMVDKVEHLIRLGAMLPGYALVCGDNHDLAEEARRMKLSLDNNRLGDNRREYAALRDEFSNGTLRRVISTYKWKQSVDFCQLSVLIRADGGRSPIISTQVPGRLSRLSPDKKTGLLIDFLDEFNESAERRAKARMASYRRNKWKITHMGVMGQ